MKAIVYTKEKCGYCIRVKHFLKMHNVEVEELYINEDITYEEIKEAIQQDFKTMPQVIINGQYIGGYKEVIAYFK